jgi:hypothetical protein
MPHIITQPSRTKEHHYREHRLIVVGKDLGGQDFSVWLKLNGKDVPTTTTPILKASKSWPYWAYRIDLKGLSMDKHEYVVEVRDGSGNVLDSVKVELSYHQQTRAKGTGDKQCRPVDGDVGISDPQQGDGACQYFAVWGTSGSSDGSMSATMDGDTNFTYMQAAPPQDWFLACSWGDFDGGTSSYNLTVTQTNAAGMTIAQGQVSVKYQEC